MSFLSPEALAFAVTLPVVVVFYLLKRRRVARLVSSTLLWQRFLNETQANSPFQKLRHNWLLIIQLILLALAVFALHTPVLRRQDGEWPVSRGGVGCICLDAVDRCVAQPAWPSEG